jgi:ribonuclease Z
VSARELIVLGTASQVPTRTRNHNGYLLRWDGEGLLFDPGEGTQRQLTFAGVAVGGVTRLCLTHLHGDHCLGVPGVVQRLSLDGAGPVHAYYPASGAEYFARLRYATPYTETASLVEVPIAADGEVLATRGFTLEARRLDHRIEAFGYRLVEPDGRRMLPDRLAEAGVHGPDVGRLQREGVVVVQGTAAGEGGTVDRTVVLEDVSEPRRGQRFAFVMDTRLCGAVAELADGVDLLVIESTYLDEDADLAAAYGHLTVGEAARVAAEGGVRTLVLTHFSRRYSDPDAFRRAAEAVFDGEVVIAEDLLRVPVPSRGLSP